MQSGEAYYGYWTSSLPAALSKTPLSVVSTNAAGSCFPDSRHCSVRALQWLPVSPRPKSTVSNLASKVLHGWTFPDSLRLWLPLLPPSAWFCLLSRPCCSLSYPVHPYIRAWELHCPTTSASHCPRHSRSLRSLSLGLCSKNVFIREATLTSLYKNNTPHSLYFYSALFFLRFLSPLTLYIYGRLFIAVPAFCPVLYCLAHADV